MKRNCPLLSFQGRALRKSGKLVKITGHVSPLVLCRTLDGFIEVMRTIAQEAKTDPEMLHSAPHNTPVGRPDETTAARQPILKYTQQ